MESIGALAGLGFGALSGIANFYSARDQQRRQEQANRDYNANMARAMGAYESGNQAAIDRYNQQAMRYMNTPDSVNAWLNPNMGYQLEQVRRQNNAQYAAGGNLLSGAAMKALQDRSQNVAKLSWLDAFNNMTTSNQIGQQVAANTAGLQTGQNSNMFNAQQGLAANQLSAAMGTRTAGAADFMLGLGAGMGATGNFMQGLGALTNSFRKSPATGVGTAATS